MNRLGEQFRTKWPIVICVVVSFLVGFGLSFVSRTATPAAEARIQIADFRVAIPEGETIVTITDRQPNGQELGRLTIERQGDTITGVPTITKRIAPRERLSADDVAFFRREMSAEISASASDWERANKIRTWLVQRRSRLGMPGIESRVAREAYEEMKEGKPVLCGNLAQIYVAFCESMGLTARTVGLTVAVQNGMFGVDTHAGAEVWLPEMGGWVYQDPTFNCYWEVDGKPASAMALHDAVMEKRKIEFAPRDKRTERGLQDYYIDPRLYFRQISYEYKPGGTVLYFADDRLEPLNLRDKNWIHTDVRDDIQRLDTSESVVIERRSEISPGVFVQLMGNNIFVRDRRERSAGIRVRSSSGTVEGCAYVHQRAEDLGVFSGNNLARNPAFRLTSRSDELADDWSVAGPVEAMTVAGGQAMSSLPGGRLWQRIKVRPNGRYLLYARVSVVRGFVSWSLAEPERGPKSTGTIEPERISEVVSDIVESQSGYLDIGFDLPSGGAFRVLDVIVTEAPRFAGTN
ncbi:MAG TPA: transglutaminase-like domain-containing protein [Pyrinomonadaceae bacterium]|nr:transglutaminase-like domain-containing protein [Pyrinomonadaceae bacterium]